jgi:hypothetical protein
MKQLYYSEKARRSKLQFEVVIVSQAAQKPHLVQIFSNFSQQRSFSLKETQGDLRVVVSP